MPGICWWAILATARSAPSTSKHRRQDHGQLLGIDGKPITIGDLWTLTPGNGEKAGLEGEIFFTAGVKDEAQGLFGSLSPVQNTDKFMIAGVSPQSMMG